MRACILTIGDELLSGLRENANACFLGRALADEGVDVVGQATVGDRSDAIRTALLHWIGRVELLILTGGLGATPDDQTRPSVARALGLRRVLHEPSAARILERKRPMAGARDGVESPALIPLGAEALENPLGLAPGFTLVHGGTLLVALPGVARELEAMWERYRTELITARLPVSQRWIWRTLETCGLSESDVAARVAPRLPAGVRAAYLPRPGCVAVRLGLRGGSEPAAEELLARAVDAVAAELG
ncbi:MAG: damage-inducible protein CinA, partial [Candidatus Eisenbacteria bacterium]|nr:damage-inducible protein CinA [Candidatus Eisenbacteria bacterium]